MSKLRALRTETLDTVAHKVGISASRLSNYELDPVQILGASTQVFFRLAAYYGYTGSEFFKELELERWI